MMMEESSNNSQEQHQQDAAAVKPASKTAANNKKDISQQTTNLLGPGTVERVFKDSVNTANQAQHDREQSFKNSGGDAAAAAQQQAATGINVSRDGRVAANRAANISVLMLGALAADSKIMDVPSNFQQQGSGRTKTFLSSLMSSSNTVINADNVFSALTKAGFPHLVEPCKKAIFEDTDTSDATVLGVRRARGQV